MKINQRTKERDLTFVFSVIEWRVMLDNFFLFDKIFVGMHHLAGDIYIDRGAGVIVRCTWDAAKKALVYTPMCIEAPESILNFMSDQNRVLCDRFQLIDDEEPCINSHHNQMAFYTCRMCMALPHDF